jgi:hypothetical protein
MKAIHFKAPDFIMLTMESGKKDIVATKNIAGVQEADNGGSELLVVVSGLDIKPLWYQESIEEVFAMLRDMLFLPLEVD